MRSLGTVFLLLLLSLFGFGFLASYSYNLYQQKAEMEAQLESLQAELGALQAQYEAVVKDRDRQAQQAKELSAKNVELLNRIQALEAERESLLNQIEIQKMRLALMEEANPLLAWLAPGSAGRLAALLIVPLVPVSLGAVYVIAHRGEAHSHAALPRAAGPASSGFQATLTREEFHLLAQHRRSRRKYQPSSVAAHSQGVAE